MDISLETIQRVFAAVVNYFCSGLIVVTVIVTVTMSIIMVVC